MDKSNQICAEMAGHNKFLYPIIKPLFEKLKVLKYPIEKQCELVCSLFELGNFDDYNILIEEDTYGNKVRYDAMNRIRQIRQIVFSK